MSRKLPGFLRSRALIRYTAIALIASGWAEKAEGRIALGVGLLFPTKLERLDEKLDEANRS